ncbi:DUF2460 domain-containing protein [Bradyrhizobium elkanii]|uniref:DUF2460 domain-containing protein n=1 Tax=Bradyrhizobium elkanii TaxID=29448 RepID=UPI0008418B9F|nr:DUF2460 domain-containing protein [Bradyrhizobium elkanii]ODM71673.1 hypothetical protein A6X20_06950 [Bradyrhizobium elkanii]ODM79045.1 hypothetical protein A6452_28535 [Bradyrhizobium elkanii]
MVYSPIPIEPIYLDGTEKTVLSGGVVTLEDDTSVLKSDSRTVSPTVRSDRVQRSWQLSWRSSSDFIMNLFEIVRNERGFLFISPLLQERQVTGQKLRNTVTGLTTGDGVTKTFQMQFAVSLPKSIGDGFVSSDTYDINYPLEDTVVAYVAGVEASLDDVNLLTGEVTYSVAPANGAPVTYDCERAWAVMFTSKSIGRTMLEVDQTEVRSAQIEEIF